MSWPPNKTNFTLSMLLALIFIVGIRPVHAQYFSTGQEAASVRWRQIKTDHIKIVFPDYYESRARQMVSYLDTVYHYSTNTLTYSPKRISLVMHTQSTTSNAVVVWAPKRMEFYTAPPQDMYAQPWLEQLALHEYRHVVQVDKLNQGPTKVISWIFGQQGTGAILGLYVPPWFLEGDAVASETGLSQSGRGRSPLFEMKLRAQLLEKGIYSYDKAVQGSYRDFTPNAYELGYHLVTEGRRQYGPELWSHSLDMVAKRPYMVTPFQKGIRDISGKRKIPFYNESLHELEERWGVQDRLSQHSLKHQLSPVNKYYTSYRFPTFLEDGSVLALKTGLDDIARIVTIDTSGKEEVIFTPGFMKYETLSYADGKVCWIETRADLRWSNRSNTVIRVLDLATGNVDNLSHRLKLFAAALSDDASRIAAVNVDSLDAYSLVVIDTERHEIIKKIPSQDNAYPLTPTWMDDDHLIAVYVSEAGKALVKINVETGEHRFLTQWDFEDILQAVSHDSYIYFVSGWSGIANIYRLDPASDSIHQISNARFGAVDPVISGDGEMLMFADYTSDGYRVVKQEIDYHEQLPLEFVFNRSIALYESLEEQEEVAPHMSEVQSTELPSKKYSKLANLFNFHSWAPLDIDVNNYEVNPGVSIMSQNLLSSSFLSAGYSYNVNEDTWKVYGTYSYQGWFPIIDLGADYGTRRANVEHHLTDEIYWNETNLSVGLRVPLNLARGAYYAGITPSIYLNQILRRMKSGIPVDFENPDNTSVKYSLQMYRQIKRSTRDIYPRWGQTINLYYYDTPFESPGYSSIMAAVGRLYFPGIVRHQGLYLYGGYQYKNNGHYAFEDLLSYPRGISGANDEHLYSIRSTYAFPIAYPDWSIGPVIYLKRFRGALFYDYAVGFNTGADNYYNSMGADLIAEVHLLRFLAPFEFGVRGIWLPEEQDVVWQFLFGVSL